MENQTDINLGFTVVKEKGLIGNFLTTTGYSNVNVTADVLISVPIHLKFFKRLRIAWQLFKYLK